MDSQRKKELKDGYKAREVTGGIYSITCNGNGRTWVRSTTDLDSIKNRFNFAVSIKSCFEPSMREEWSKYGEEAFSFTVLEKLVKKEDQSSKEFSDDIKLLYEMWVQKHEL